MAEVKRCSNINGDMHTLLITFDQWCNIIQELLSSSPSEATSVCVLTFVDLGFLVATMTFLESSTSVDLLAFSASKHLILLVLSALQIMI